MLRSLENTLHHKALQVCNGFASQAMLWLLKCMAYTVPLCCWKRGKVAELLVVCCSLLSSSWLPLVH